MWLSGASLFTKRCKFCLGQLPQGDKTLEKYLCFPFFFSLIYFNVLDPFLEARTDY